MRSCFSIATDFLRTTCNCYPIIETNRTNCAFFSHCFHLSKNYFNYSIVLSALLFLEPDEHHRVPSRRASTCLVSLSLSLAFFNSLCRGPSALRRLFVTPKFIRCLPRLSLKHRPSFSFLLNRFIPLYPDPRTPPQTRILSRSPTRAPLHSHPRPTRV